MKGRRGIAQSKRHDKILIVLVVRPKHSFVHVLTPHLDLVITLSKIKFGKVCSTVKLIEHVVDYGYRKPIFYGHFI